MPIQQHLSWIFQNTPTFSFSDGFQSSYGHVFWDPTFFWLTLYVKYLIEQTSKESKYKSKSTYFIIDRSFIRKFAYKLQNLFCVFFVLNAFHTADMVIVLCIHFNIHWHNRSVRVCTTGRCHIPSVHQIRLRSPGCRHTPCWPPRSRRPRTSRSSCRKDSWPGRRCRGRLALPEADT